MPVQSVRRYLTLEREQTIRKSLEVWKHADPFAYGQHRVLATHLAANVEVLLSEIDFLRATLEAAVDRAWHDSVLLREAAEERS